MDLIALLGTHLKGANGCRLETQIGLEILCNFTHQTLERQLADEQLGRLLVTTDLTQSNSSGTITMGLLHATGGGRRFTGCLGGQLLARSFASSGFTSGLLGTCHLCLLRIRNAARRETQKSTLLFSCNNNTHKMRCTALRRWRATDANVATVAQMKRANSSRCRRRCSSSANKRGLKNLQFQLWTSSSTAQHSCRNFPIVRFPWPLLCCFLGTLHNFHFNGDVDVCCCCSPQRSRAHLAYCACVFSFSLYWFFLWARHESVGFFFSFAPLAYPPPWKLPATANIAFLFVLRPLEASCISRFA